MNKSGPRVWKFFKVILIIFLSLLVIISILPYFFRNQIKETVKTEINKQVNARVDFQDFSLSLIRNFPHFNCRLDEISVTGINEFDADTLVHVASLSMTIDLMSVLEGDVYIIRKISVDKPEIMLRVNSDGLANWDLVPEAEEETQEQIPQQPSDYVISLKSLQITDADLDYIDKSTGTKVHARGLQHKLSGDFTLNNTRMSTHTFIKSLSINEGGVDYVHDAAIEFNAFFDADLKNEIYTFRQNSLKINELLLRFDGSVAMVNEDVNTTITFDTPQSDFKHFLSLIPAVYSKDFESIQTAGKLSIDGHIKGIYNDLQIPSFRVNIGIDDAMLKYPDLPYPVDDISLRAMLSNPGGDINNTAVDISNLHLKILQNPIDIRLKLENLMEDPLIDGEVKGILDLAAIKEVYPLEQDEDMQGKIIMNVSAKGNLSAIENEKYEEFKAMGSLLVQRLKYSSGAFADGIFIRNAQVNFSPSYLDLVNLDFAYRESDMKADGKIEQYLGYALGDKQLTGKFNTRSASFNVNDFMETEGDVQSNINTDTIEASAFRVPANIDFELKSSFDKLIYDKVTMEDVSGSILVRDQTIFINDLKADVYEGSILVNGRYTTKDRTDPLVDMDLAIKEISIADAYSSFGIMEKLAPVAEHVFGTFSTSLAFKSALDQEMMPVLTSMMGNGSLNSSQVKVENVKSLTTLSNLVKIEELKAMDLNPLSILFTIEEGKVDVKPFKIQSGQLKANVSGWTAFDQRINYVMNMSIPRKMFGQEANTVLDDLLSKANIAGTSLSLGETIDLDILFTGTATDPKVSTNLVKLGKNIVDDTKKQLEEELKKKKEEAKKKASEEAQRILDEADARAKKILQEAQVKADEVIMAAEAAAIEVRTESDKQAKRLMDEAKGKGTLAELGAKKAADEVKKEGNKRANQLVEEAGKQAQNIMTKARAEAKKVKDDAQKRVDALK